MRTAERSVLADIRCERVAPFVRDDMPIVFIGIDILSARM